MSILVYLESAGGKLKGNAREAATAGRRLAKERNSELVGVVFGEADTSPLKPFGFGKLLKIAGDQFAAYSGDRFAAALDQAARQENAEAVLLMASSRGKDLAPRLAARRNIAAIADIIDLVPADSGLPAGLRPIFAGKARVLVRPAGDFAVYTLRPKAFTPEPGDDSDFPVTDLSVSVEEAKAVVREIEAAAGAKIDLTEADIIVSGGRGMGGPENYGILEELAELLGGTVGASRAAVDAGWRPHSDQVGQTGKTVSPSLYIACGISGAIQHLAGMSSSKVIVAINKDPDAPIFKVADYGIVGDLFEVVPALTAALKN